MHSDRDALLAAIRANPEEDTPRLMFADWLDENGDPERAEFIRLQCELAQATAEGSASYAMYAFLRERYPTGLAATDWTRIDLGVHCLVALSVRANDLLNRHGQTWVPKLPKKYKVQWAGFDRGFAHRVTLDARKLKETAGRLRAAGPAVTLVAENVDVRFVEQLADAGLLGWVCGLQLQGDSAAGLREWGNRREARTVRVLNVPWAGGAGDIAAALAETPGWAGLHTLDLSGAAIDAAAAELLFGAKHLCTLHHLSLRGNADWTADTIRAFTKGGFAELTALAFVLCGLDDDAAELLAACPHLTNLRTLNLHGNSITGRGATALLASRHLANVAYLGLDDNPCTGLDAKRLAKAKPGGLRLLSFHGARLRTADVRALARCPRLRTLWYLDLDQNNIGTPAVRELVRGFGKWCPPILWLTYNRIDDRGAELLANWKAAANLSALHLKYNPAMTDAGIQALLDSPHLANLDILGASIESDDLDARLRARFRRPEVNY